MSRTDIAFPAMPNQNNLWLTTKQNVRCVLLPAQQGLSRNRFLKDYHDLIGKPLPYRELGYQTVEDFLKAIPDVVNFSECYGGYILKAVADERTTHIEKLVQNQRINSKNRPLPWLQRPVSRYATCNDPIDDCSWISANHDVSSESILSSSSPSSYFPSSDAEVALGSLSPPLAILTTAASISTPVELSPKLPLSILNQGISDRLPKIVNRKRRMFYPNPGISPKPPESKSEVNVAECLMTTKSPNYYNEVMSNIRKTLQVYTDGVYLDEFFHAFCLNSDIPLIIKDFGYKTMEDFLVAIQEDVPLKLDYFTNIRPKVHYVGDDISLSLQTAKFFADMNYKVPDDVVLPGSKYTIQALPSVREEKYFPVYTGSVMNPSTIWIQLKGKNTSRALSLLEKNMDALYKSKQGKSYTMRDQDVIVGALGVAIWAEDGFWYRMRISSIGVDFVKVFFVDYGHVSKEIPRESLRYLKREFMELSAQAIKTRMAFVAPTRQEWSIEVRERLLKLCRDKTLMAEHVNCPHYPDIVSLWLCDCNGADDIHLNQLLIDEGLARYYDEKCATVPLASNSSSNQGSTPAAQSTATAGVAEALKLICTLAENPDSRHLLNTLVQCLTTANQQQTEIKQPLACSDALPFCYGSSQDFVSVAPQQNFLFPSAPMPNCIQQSRMPYLDSVNNSKYYYPKNEEQAMYAADNHHASNHRQ